MENDLISRSALLKPFEEMRTRLKEGGNGTAAGFVLAFIRVIEREPSVDAVEVVRCKDCIHYEMGVCLKIYSDGAVSEYAWQERKPDDFCSYGERKV